MIKVLTIDDEVYIRRNIAAYLEDSGFEVFQAENGRVGLQKFNEEKPDILIMDLHMPEVDGFEVLKVVTKQAPEIPIIVISGTGAIQTAIEATRLGAWDFLQKPIHDMSVLELTIEHALERARLIRENRAYKEHLEEQVLIRTQNLEERAQELEKLNERLTHEINQRKRAEESLNHLNEELEKRVAERTSQLEESLESLHKTQNQLIQQEKMASIGSLTAGIAHEINTPIGIGVTAASHIQDQTHKINSQLDDRRMSLESLQKYLDIVKETSKILLENLNRAAEFVIHFKEVAVDQSTEKARVFNLKQYIEGVLTSLYPKLKKQRHQVEVLCDDSVVLYSFPGAFFQILSNFVMNSILHGFREGQQGKICIQVWQEGGQLFLTYKDDGRGIPQNILPKIFDPFFTTRRGSGGTGLGMHIIYNLVTQKLNGEISCESRGEGVCFTINFPLLVKQDKV